MTYQQYATAIFAANYGDEDYLDVAALNPPPAREEQADDPYALFAILQQNEES